MGVVERKAMQSRDVRPEATLTTKPQLNYLFNVPLNVFTLIILNQTISYVSVIETLSMIYCISISSKRLLPSSSDLLS